MITLLASIAGFITSLVPEIVKFFKDKNDKKHEIEILKMQIEMSRYSDNSRLDEIRIHESTNEIKNLYSTYKSGIFWVDALNSSVRPVLAYCFFVLYTYLKYIQFLAVSKYINSTGILVDIIWTTDDQAIFAGIISFYFGQRTFSRVNNRNAKN